MKYLLILIFLSIGELLFAQETVGNKTIEITSSFKPSLIPPSKLNFSASPVVNSGKKAALMYQLPVEKLSFNFSPAPLKPLAYNDTSTHTEDRGYLKVGYGNFATPYLRGAFNYGNGVTSNGYLEADFMRSKGKLTAQEFAQFGLKTNNVFQLNENHNLEVRAGLQGNNYFRYGFRPDSMVVNKDSLKLNYTNLHAGATIGNQQANQYGLYYKAGFDANLFSDNKNGNETSFRYDMPLEKQLTEDIAITVGISGLVSRVNIPDTAYNNNVTLVKAGARFRLKETIYVNAALVPSWNNGTFALLPDVSVETYLTDKDFVLQGGVKGSYIYNTWQNLANINPWIEQPGALTHSRNTEFFAALKAVVDARFSFRIKGNYQRRLDVPLLINSEGDGKTFNLIWEPAVNIVGVSAEFVLQSGSKFSWSNQATLQAFNGLKNADKAFGMLPFEYTSSARFQIADKLTLKGDAYAFLPTWYQSPDKKTKTGMAAFDLNLGAEFDVLPKVKLWLQFNNVFNSQYERWNQYQVLGFQALGGAILRF